MVRALTKRRTTGELYVRPPEIEAAIESALTLEPPELLRRSRIPDPKHPEFLPPECLVHVIRLTEQAGDHDLSSSLLDCLFQRCAAMLAAMIRGRGAQRDGDLRQEVLDRFADKFVADAKPDALDIYEVRFGRAFRMLRIDVLRSAIEDSVEFVPLVDGGSDEAEGGEETLSVPPAQHVELLSKEMKQAAWRLPKELRKPVVLVYLMGYEIESNDPSKKTAATLCRVSGRTIRTRLAEGLKCLKKFMEEK
jgi:DNA-directed RNA polymerase specialized sigma24 family protein